MAETASSSATSVKSFLNLLQWAVRVFIIPLGGITLNAGKLTYICFRDNLTSALPYSIMITLVSFTGLIIAIYGGFYIESKDKTARVLDEKSVTPDLQDRVRSIGIRKYDLIWKILSLFLCFFILYIIEPIFAISNLLNLDILKMLVQIETTLLGFYGLIFTYMLNSLDLRQDRYEDQKFLITQGDRQTGSNGGFAILPFGTGISIRFIDKKIIDIIKSRKFIVRQILFTFSTLFSSMIIALCLIGLINHGSYEIKGLLSSVYILSTLFIFSFLNLIFTFYKHQ